MNDFQPVRYLKKYAGLIVAFFCVLTVALDFVLRFFQTYTATVVVDFVYEGAENGIAPDGSELNTTDIYSSSVISQALENLGLDQSEYPIDSIRSAITVEQIADEAVDTVNEAKNQEGETSDLQPTKYSISYKVKEKQGPETARLILDEILDVYFTQFSTKYVNTSSVVNSTSTVNRSIYDYIEQIELIESALEDTITSLMGRVQSSPYFYSSDTGYSFNELANEFSLLRSTEVSSLYAYILQHRVTRDLDALLNKYSERVESSQREQEQYKARITEVEGILNAYVEKLRESNNTAQSQVIGSDGYTLKNNNVLGDVESPNYSESGDHYEAYDQTTEYEKLLQNWIDISDSYNDSVIDEGYSQYVIDCYQGNTEAVIAYQESVSQITNQSGADTEIAVADEEVQANAIQQELSSGIYTEGTVPCTQEDIDYVEVEIDRIVSRMNELYELTERTDLEYNEYLGAEYIEVVSSNRVTEGLNLPLYTALGAVLFLGIGALGAIFLGRIGDIIEYIAFTDHQYRIPNRIACDRYIQKHKDKTLPPEFACLLFQVINVSELNRRLGRNNADEVLAYFAALLKEMFREMDAFVGYNGSGQFMVFVQKANGEELRSAVGHFNAMLNEYMKEKQVVLKYSAGISVCSEDNIYRIRELISTATKRKEQYDVGISE